MKYPVPIVPIEKPYLFAFRINTSTEKHNTTPKNKDGVIQFDHADCQ